MNSVIVLSHSQQPVQPEDLRSATEIGHLEIAILVVGPQPRHKGQRKRGEEVHDQPPHRVTAEDGRSVVYHLYAKKHASLLIKMVIVGGGEEEIFRTR